MSENEENEPYGDENQHEAEVTASSLKSKLDDLENIVSNLVKGNLQRDKILRRVLTDLVNLEKKVFTRDESETYDKFQIYVGNIYIETTEQSLREYFESYGTVIDVQILKKHERTKCAFVEFSQPEEAQEALNIRPHIVNGNRLIVKKKLEKNYNKLRRFETSPGPKSPKATSSYRFNPY